MCKIELMLKSKLHSLAFYIKARPKLLRLAMKILHHFPKLDSKLRMTLFNDLASPAFKTIDLIYKMDDEEHLRYLRTIKQQVEDIKKRKI